MSTFDRKPSVKEFSDVTFVAGIDMEREKENFLPSIRDVGFKSRPELDSKREPFLQLGPLKNKIFAILQKKNMVTTTQVFNVISLATEEYMFNILKILATGPKMRNVNEEDDQSSKKVENEEQVDDEQNCSVQDLVKSKKIRFSQKHFLDPIVISPMEVNQFQLLKEMIKKNEKLSPPQANLLQALSVRLKKFDYQENRRKKKLGK